jgi:protein-S-isoprenylcysteine O-methyltransferase Ste14
LDTMRVFGTPTINPVVFVLGKLALVPPFLFLGRAVSDAWQGTLAFPRLAPVAAAAVIAGVTAALAAIRHLGDAVRVGLPEEQTSFKTRGLYRFSRNPIYAGILLALSGSCVLVPHWFNIAATVVAGVVHHRIILGEERFLEDRFGGAWRDYRGKVRRYL